MLRLQVRKEDLLARIGYFEEAFVKNGVIAEQHAKLFLGEQTKEFVRFCGGEAGEYLGEIAGIAHQSTHKRKRERIQKKILVLEIQV